LTEIQPPSAQELIIKMLENNPENRSTSTEVVLQIEKIKQVMNT
jgi:serine/threonine protein kinase